MGLEVITLGTGTLANDGKTLTFPLLTSGVTGVGYGPSSGVTGLAIHTSGSPQYFYNISAATISGTTLTLVSTSPIPTGLTIQVDISSGSNITDGASNTATGQTNIGITNSSSQAGTNVSGEDATKVIKSGYWGFQSVVGHNAYSGQGVDSTMDLAFTLDSSAPTTSISIPTWSSGNFIYVSLDGGAFAFPTITNTGNYSFSTLLSGITSGAHTLTLLLGSAAIVDRDLTLQFCGAVPTFSLPTSLGTPVVGVTAPAGTQVYLNDPATTSFIYGEGDFNPVATNFNYSASGRHSILDQHPHSSIRTRMKGTDLWAWMYRGDTTSAISVDGVYQTSAGAITHWVSPNDGVWGWTKIATGLDGTKFQVVQTQNISLTASGNGGGTYYYALMATGGASPSIDLSTANPPRVLSAAYGDSITQQTADAICPNGGYVLRLGQLTGNAVFSDGYQGTQVCSTGSTGTAGVNRTGNITSATTVVPISYLNIHYGVNDADNGVAIGNASMAGTFTGDFKTMLNDFLAAIPTTKIVVLGILGNSSHVYSFFAPYNAAIQVAIAACTSPSSITYIDPVTKCPVAGTAYYAGGSFDGTKFADGLHPNDLGMAMMAAAMAPFNGVTVASGGNSLPKSLGVGMGLSI